MSSEYLLAKNSPETRLIWATSSSLLEKSCQSSK